MSQGGGFFQGSQGSPGEGKKSDKNTVRPVTISQLLAAFQPHPDADFSIDQVDVNQVVFIGKVMNVSRGSTNISYAIEDGTGQIDVRQWVEAATNDDGTDPDQIEQDTLVKVMGTVKVFSNKRSITALSVRPVTDMNEQQFHMLEVIYLHLLHTKGPINTGGAGGYGNVNNAAYSRSNGTSAANANDQYSHLPPLQRKIMAYIVSLGSTDQLPQEGINVQAIIRSTGMDPDQIRAEVENLVQDGQLYSTTDEDHVMPT